ncbi:alpha/beta fold hydrolase [Catelliglobosispora koreensis]|uniref:alpha/beta fold hydrolase n=1 Tax=Catelliglobosispora koreensis TaxID=129052 RepID=UPI000382B6ED|nr:alpha/beta fold hydrolase [Catelliglobosispora koreensis]
MEDRSVLERAARPADAEMYFGDPRRPVIALIHGGFWRPEYDLTHLRPMASALADLGWPVALLEYTRIPGRPDLMVADIKRAMDSLPDDIIVMGHSAGGHLALWAAGYRAGLHGDNTSGPATDGSAAGTVTSGPPGGSAAAGEAVATGAAGMAGGHAMGASAAGNEASGEAGSGAAQTAAGREAMARQSEGPQVPVIALAPVADLELARELNLDEGAVQDFLGDHSPEPYQPAVSRATIIHGDDDVIVPVSVSERYLSRHVEGRLIRVPAAGHFALIDPHSEAWPVVIDELNRLLA